MARPDVLALLARQHWVAGVAQLGALAPPVSASAVKRACASGALERVHRGVVKLGAVELGFAGRVLALQLAIGGNAFVSGTSAGVLHGLRSMPRHIQVTVHEDFHSTLPGDHRIRLTNWLDEPRDVVERPDGIRVASPLRMLFGLARDFNQHRFERAAEDVWHRRLATPEQAVEYLTAIRRSGKNGVTRMQTWLEDACVRAQPSQSGLESVLIQLVERVGLPTPVRQHPLRLRSGELIHLDIAWPGVRLAVEPGHSWWHGGDLRQRADQTRDRACGVVGWHVHRYDESATQDLAGTAQELLELYRQRAADLGRPGF